MGQPELSKAVAKTMSILECLAREKSIGLTDLARLVSVPPASTRMNKSTAYRFLASLEQLGFVRQDSESGKYELTLKILEIGTAVLERMDLRKEAEPVLKEMARVTGETIHLATLDENRLVYIDKIESTKALRVSMMSRIGKTAPAYCTGLGKTLLAYLPRSRVDDFIRDGKLKRLTEKTITSREHLDRELASIRRSGYALDDEEHEIGVRCVAAPVRDNRGNVCAAVSMSAPVVRLTDGEIPHCRKIVMDAAEEISRRIGYGSNSPSPTRDGRECRQTGRKKVASRENTRRVQS